MAHYVAIRNGMSASDEKALSNIPVAFINTGGGVVNAVDYQILQHGATPANPSGGTPNNTVDVYASPSSPTNSRAYVPTSDGTMMYSTRLDAVANVAIGSNASGNPRIDSIVLYIDLSASPDAAADNVAKFFDVQGTPAGSPVAPTNSQILTQIGAGNPYIVLGNVNVPNGFSGSSSVTSGSITDQRPFAAFNTGQTIAIPQFEEFTDQSSAPASPASGKTRVYTKGGGMFAKTSSGGIAQIGSNTVVIGGVTGSSVAVDWSQGIVQAFTMGAGAGGSTQQPSITFSAFNNPVAGVKMLLILTQGSAGSNGTTLAFPGTVKWPNGNPPVLSTAAGKVDILGFIYDGTSFYGVSSLTY